MRGERLGDTAMRFKLLQTILYVSLGIAASLVSANAQNFQSRDRMYQGVRYLDQRDNAMARRHGERRSYRPVHRHVERYRVRPVYRHVERRHPRPVHRYARRGAQLAEPVYYYDGTLVGRDPDANIRLMLLKDNARTLWAR